MAELRKCGNSWAFCDGDCGDCRTIATASTQLAQDLPITCTDTINRWDAINVLMDMAVSLDKDPDCQDIDEADRTLNNAMKALWVMPSAQPERKKGKWIERNPNNSPECRLIECSECGNTYIVNMGLLLEDWAEGRNFCIRCGADMRGDSHG